MSCSRQSSAIERSPRSDASTISSFCFAVHFRYLRCSLNLCLPSVERPILSRPPDSPSGATRLRDCPALQPSYLSTQDRGAGHDEGSSPSASLAGFRSTEGLRQFGE